MHPEVGAGGELNFWNERGAVWHRSIARTRTRGIFWRKQGQITFACCFPNLQNV